jgi:hypothetical protein
MTAPTRLSIHNSVPNPYSVGRRRSAANCCSSSWAGLVPEQRAERRFRYPNNPFHVYTHGLSCHANRLGHLRTALAHEQQPTRLQSLLCRFAQPFLCHDAILQYHLWRYNASVLQRSSLFMEISIAGRQLPTSPNGAVYPIAREYLRKGNHVTRIAGFRNAKLLCWIAENKRVGKFKVDHRIRVD